MNANVTEDSVNKVFIENYNCKVQLKDNGNLSCATSGRLLTVALFVVGMLFIYGSIFIIGWDLPQGRMHSSSLFWGALVFITGIFFQWRCHLRKKELGTFEIDREKRLVGKSGMDAGYSFDYITRLRLALDWTALGRIHKMPPVPYWLFIHFRNGRKIRIATGRRDEINQVLGWMRDAGISGVEWV